MAVAHKDKSHSACNMDRPDLKPSITVKDSDDYGGIGIDEFSRRIQTDNDARYGDVIRNATWEDVGEAGW